MFLWTLPGAWWGNLPCWKCERPFLFGVAQLTPREVADFLGKCAWFHPSASAIHQITQEMGLWLEEHEELPQEIRSEEPVPAETKILVGSMDGVNVLLAEPGPKPGRPSEATRCQGQTVKSPTCYKNAMVGCLSCYGEVPQDQFVPGAIAKPIRGTNARGRFANVPDGVGGRMGRQRGQTSPPAPSRSCSATPHDTFGNTLTETLGTTTARNWWISSTPRITLRGSLKPFSAGDRRKGSNGSRSTVID